MLNAIKKSLQGSNRIGSRISKIFGASSPPKPQSPVTEEPDLYGPGGFHHVSFGDIFNSGKYTIRRKLGYGQYSTVWLARDASTEGYVALKILRADCYGGPHDIYEREILSHISNVSKKSNHSGHNYISHLLDEFKHVGPNGKHVCLVFDVLGHHLDFQTAHFEDSRLPIPAVKSITRQILLGLDFLHRECGVIHTDLKPSNILLELENPKEAISNYLADVRPRNGKDEDGAVVPLREVIRTPLVSEMKKPHIRIVDFGVSSWTDRPLTDSIQSPALRAPEVTLGAEWGPGVDIWSLGCLMIEFVQGYVPFSGKASKYGTWTVDDDRLARMIEILGPFPSSLLKRGKNVSSFFDDKGNLIRVPEVTPTSLERMLNGNRIPLSRPEGVSDAEVGQFVDFVRGMLTIDPEQRKSAKELLQHEWLI